jgi:hypothetical protein
MGSSRDKLVQGLGGVPAIGAPFLCAQEEKIPFYFRGAE